MMVTVVVIQVILLALVLLLVATFAIMTVLMIMVAAVTMVLIFFFMTKDPVTGWSPHRGQALNRNKGTKDKKKKSIVYCTSFRGNEQNEIKWEDEV